MAQPNYYGIIPANVRYHKELTSLEKFLYCEFTALSNMNGYCSAGNEYFAKLYNKDKATISRSISHLEELKLICIEYDRRGARVVKRRIYPLDIKTTNDKIVNGTETTNDKNITREQEKMLLTIDKIVKENNSSYEDIIKLIIVSFKKEKKERKDIDIQLQMLAEFGFDKIVSSSIENWLIYKKEKQQTYKASGFKTLLNKLKKWIDEFGNNYVLDAIESSMSNNYTGIFPENKNNSKKLPQQNFEQRHYTKEDFENMIDSLDNPDLEI